MTSRLPAALASATSTLALGAGLLAAAPAQQPLSGPAVAQHAADAVIDPDSVERPAVTIDARVLGRSGALRVTVVETFAALDFVSIADERTAEPLAYQWVPQLGTPPEPVAGEVPFAQGVRAPLTPGVWTLSVRGDGWRHEVPDLLVVTRVPFDDKRGGRLNGYHIGRYPTEGSGRTDEYAPPVGFIEVTPANKDLPVSDNFRLGQFLTKDQFDVWPKYVALDLRLIDKLELVLQELNAMGIRAERMHVMSGFRTPQYNGPGGDGRAALSRHMYGDAADVWIDNQARGWIDDLNGDGNGDIRDVNLMLRAVERVERRFPELAGGAGTYLHNGVRGPFIHVDVRGEPTRW